MAIDKIKNIEDFIGKKNIESFNAFESIIDAYLVMTIGGDVIKMNEAAISLLGFDLEKEGFNITSIIHPEDYQYAMESFSELLKKGIYRDYKARVNIKNGEVKWVHINASLIYDDKKNPIAAQGIIRDITEEKRNVNLIKQQAEELSAIVDNSPLGVVLTSKGNFLKSNKAFQNFIGYNEEELKNLTIEDVSYPLDFHKSVDSLNKMTSGQVNNFSIEKRYLKKDKTAVWAKTTINAIREFSNEGVVQVAIIEDITVKREKNIIVETVNNVAKSIIGKLDVSEIAMEISYNISNYLGTNDCVIYRSNKEKQTLEQISGFGNKLDENKNIKNKLVLKHDEGIVGSIAKSGVAEIINDTSIDKRYKVDDKNRFSEICVPIIYDDEVVGVIDAEHKQKDYFNKEHLKTLENVASLVAMQFKNAINRQENILAKKQLEESESRLANLIVNLDEGILLEDENRKIILANKKFCSIFNIPVDPEFLIGQDCNNAAQESKDLFLEPETFVSLVNKIVVNKKTVLANELKMKNGNIYELDYTPIFLNKIYKGHLWTYRDVSIQRKYKESLEAQRLKYSQIIENMNLGLIEVDETGKVMMVNKSFEKMSGYSRADLMGINPRNLFLDDASAEHIEKENKKRLKGVSNSYEVTAKTKSNEKRHWLISGAPNYDIDGNVIGSIGVHLDITELKLLENQKEILLDKLEKNNKELQEYAHIVSHDLKSPLRNVSALTAWLKEDFEDSFDEDGLQKFKHIEDTLSKMDQLIDGVLNYSSIDKKTAKIEKINLNTLLKTILNTIYVPPHINVTILHNLPTIHADSIKIEQLFQNLISNAINYMDKDEGWIKIDFSDKKSHYEFSVSDNGIGIPKKYFKKIFNIFQSVNEKQSTGIGLSIVKRIVELYNGKIWLESELGKGTTFYFTLKK